MFEPQAAVVLLHCLRPGPAALLLIRRSQRADDPWSGQWALPGGRRDPGDLDLRATARRELREECGVDLAPDLCLEPRPIAEAGRHANRLIEVAPFAVALDQRPDLDPDATEVAACRWLTLDEWRDPGRHGRAAPLPERPDLILPCLDLEGLPLWGLTYRVIAEWMADASTPSSLARRS